MKSLLTQLASTKVNIDEDIVIVVLLKSLPDEDCGNVITTLTKLSPTSLVEVKTALLEEERRIKARKGGHSSIIKEEEVLFTKGKLKGKITTRGLHR